MLTVCPSCDLFDRMVALRVEIAREAGFPDFVGYAYRLRERFDYGVAETVEFQQAIERVVVPLARQLQEERRLALGVETLTHLEDDLVMAAGVERH